MEGHIYQGIVKGVKQYGIFVAFDANTSKHSEGLCHVSEMDPQGHRVEQPGDIVKFGDQVYVKVIRVHHDGKISLSMRGIDQKNGKTLKELRSRPRQDDWELNQMSHAYGVKRQRTEENDDIEDPFAEVESEPEERDEEINVEVSSKVPSFLEGKKLELQQTYEPARVSSAPEGSLETIAKNGSRYMGDIRAERIKQKREQQELGVSDQEVAKNLAVEEWRRQIRSQGSGIKHAKSVQDTRQSLPIYSCKKQLLDEVKAHNMLVVVGETGSGKSTQITQYLAEEGYTANGVIACTQPRRVAAISVAKRVAEEVGCSLGDKVGYTIRFEDCTGPNTQIKYMTDGMLEREALIDPLMKKYSVIMLDEAHERTVATDVLFALLRDAVRKRKGALKLIVTSATLDSEKFSKYFDGCPVFHIEGRSFPVKKYYTKEPEVDYIEATIETVVDVHANNPPGDILVFLTGREEIETCCEAIVQKMSRLYKENAGMSELIVLPIYSAMPSEMQSRIFDAAPEGKRKVVVATNIAETSITIDGIYYVVDPGFVKVNAYDPKLGMDSLIVQPISRAQADQRAGRAGRTGPGICYRLYTKAAYANEMAANTIPEIQRQNLSNTILMLKAMGIRDVLNFGFMDPPSEQSVLHALEELYVLDALDDQGGITDTGKQMSCFPMEPLLSKTLIQSISFGCSEEVIVIIAMLSVPEVFYRPRDKREKADRAKQHFEDYSGDHLTLLNVYQKWQDSNYSKSWCQQHYLHDKSLRKARDVQKQLVRLWEQMQRRKQIRSPLTSCQGHWDQVRKAFVSGYFKNCAKRSSDNHSEDEGTFRTLVENTPVHIHPSSSLFRKGGFQYVLYHTLLLTNKEYMQCITRIDPQWLVEYAPKFYRKGDKALKKIEPLFNRGDDSWRLSRR